MRQINYFIFIYLYLINISYATLSDRQLQIIIKENNYTVNRSLLQYFAHFLPSGGFSDNLLPFLESLNNGDRVLDAGAGECTMPAEWLGLLPFNDFGVLADETHKGHADIKKLQETILGKQADAMPHFTAITYAMDQKAYDTYSIHPNLEILQGRFFSDIPDDELGHYKMIVDVFGILSYSNDIDNVMSRYLRMLEQNGRIYIIMHNSVNITLGNGGEISFPEWLQIQGILVDFNIQNNIIFLVIQKDITTPIDLPKLTARPIVAPHRDPTVQYDDFIDGSLPRYFVEEESKCAK